MYRCWYVALPEECAAIEYLYSLEGSFGIKKVVDFDGIMLQELKLLKVYSTLQAQSELAYSLGLTPMSVFGDIVWLFEFWDDI